MCVEFCPQMNADGFACRFGVNQKLNLVLGALITIGLGILVAIYSQPIINVLN